MAAMVSLLTLVIVVLSVAFCYAQSDSNECVRIDAALTKAAGDIYLIHGDDYVRFNAEGNETRQNSITEFGGLRGRIDAAVIWYGNGKTYFFKGKNYYKLAFLVVGPYKTIAWGPDFADGIDAAGNLNAKSYFFKGCRVVSIIRDSEDRRKTEENVSSESVGLPCNVDAAFSKDEVLYVIKGDKVWRWASETEKAGNPKPLTDVLSLESWNVCSVSDEE